MKSAKMVLLGAAVVAIAWALMSGPVAAVDSTKESEFASSTIDLGVIVSDVEKSVSFYTNAVGFTEVEGFSVPADFCKDSGLTDGHPLKVRVLVLGQGTGSTKLKLIELPGVSSKTSDNAFIHSQLGYRYTTIFVNDVSRAMARLKEAGVTPIAKGPVALPEGFPKGVYLTCIKDPDGNLVELVGPRK